MPHSTWAVAAAILVIENCSMKPNALKNRVENTRLTGLGSRGGRTTAKTLRTDIDTRHSDIFQAIGNGYYQVCDAAALKIADVRHAVSALVKIEFDEYCDLLNKITSERLGFV